MAKTVFSKTADVAREWAKGDLGYVRTGSNTSARNGILMSYGTPIGAIVRDVFGERVALVSTRQWSSGTSKVQGEACYEALAINLAVFRVPALGAAPEDVETNLAHYTQAIHDLLDKLERGRVTSADSYRKAAGAVIATARDYADRFGVAWSWTGPDPDSVKHAKEDS